MCARSKNGDGQLSHEIRRCWGQHRRRRRREAENPPPCQPHLHSRRARRHRRLRRALRARPEKGERTRAGLQRGRERKSAVWGKRVDLGGRRIIKKKRTREEEGRDDDE